jgi:hypothetical protein
MNVALFQLDGKLPNIALMRLSAHHKAKGDSVAFYWTAKPYRDLFARAPEVVYGSAIFEKTMPAVNRLKDLYPWAIVGGTGVALSRTLEDIGVTTLEQDYSIYPKFQDSIGFSQRGCRLKCSFCVVPKKEGGINSSRSVYDIWRGEPWPKHLHLLDNDFFGSPEWPERIKEIKEGGFKVCFSQGINARFLNEESATAIASIEYRDDSFKTKRIYTAWDNRKDEKRLFAGLEALKAAGVKPDAMMVYILVGYWDGPRITEDDHFRRERLREFGCRPYPMPFVRNDETMGFQRWIIGAYDKRFSWDEWKAANYRPERLGTKPEPLFDAA